jgi:phosphatidylserine/phosphatidylglycerophosphate/cardiolipin synthase-like enzyme
MIYRVLNAILAVLNMQISVDGDCDGNYTLQNLLIQKAKQKIDIKILVWEPRPIVRKLPNSRKRGLEAWGKKFQTVIEAIKRFGVEDYITIRLDTKAPTLTSGFHEKIMIIDNQIAFCGGQDLSLGKWDTSDHEFDNPSRDLGGEPWHDIHTMVICSYSMWPDLPFQSKMALLHLERY